MVISLRHLRELESGQDLVEYGFLVTFIALTALGAVRVLGTGMARLWSDVATQLLLVFG